jgi:hypothetical protein
MKRLAALVLLAAGPAGASDFFVEEKALQSVPGGVDRAIRAGRHGTWVDFRRPSVPLRRQTR